MDINKVQKLNELAINLRKHNINHEDAVAQAEKIYGTENNYFTPESPDEVNEVKKDVRRLTFALQEAISEIKGLKSQVTKLEKELNDARVNQLPRRITEEPSQPVQQHSKPVQAKLAEEKKITSPIDRNGVAPSDVAIDKFFYFGQK